MLIGRYLEKKIKMPAMIVLIHFMGIISNTLYMVITTFVCQDPAHASTNGLARKYTYTYMFLFGPVRLLEIRN